MSEKRFIQLGDTHIKDTITGEEWYAPCETSLLETLNELMTQCHELKEEKDYLVAVIDKNLLKGEHEQFIKHKEAKEKMKKGESSEVSPILDVVFYWTGYIKALEELKEEVE